MADFQESRGVTPVDGTDDREARSKIMDMDICPKAHIHLVCLTASSEPLLA